MSVKILLGLLLILNHSLMFGVSQAAHIPDEDHPYGQALEYEHHHQHGDAVANHNQHDHADEPLPLADSLIGDEDHEHSHKHGVHVHLNCDLPYSLSFSIDPAATLRPAFFQSLHQGLAYAPPVPPPNR